MVGQRILLNTATALKLVNKHQPMCRWDDHIRLCVWMFVFIPALWKDKYPLTPMDRLMAMNQSIYHAVYKAGHIVLAAPATAVA